MIKLYSDNNRIEVLENISNEEPLFLCLNNYLDYLDNKFDKKTTKVENWMDAKSFVEKLLKRSHPECLIQIMANNLHETCCSLSSDHRDSDSGWIGATCITNLYDYQTDNETVIVLFYSMLIIHYLTLVDKDLKYQSVKNALKKHIDRYRIIDNIFEGKLIGFITENVDNGTIKPDYDYINNKPMNSNNSSLETTVDSTVNEKDQLIQQLQEQLRAYESGSIVEDPHDKVRLELATRLLEESGADFEKHGNKAEAARMEELITGLPFQTCKNYMTNRDLNTTKHSDEVLKVNTSLKKLGINWQL